MPAELLALTEGPNITLKKTITVFGRHPECDVQLNSRKVSRRHCVIADIGTHLSVRDLGSTNGVRINGVRQDRGEVRNGDELLIGGFRFQVVFQAPAVSPPSPVPAPVAVPSYSQMPTRRLLNISERALEQADEPVPLDESMMLQPRPKPHKEAHGNAPMDSFIIPEYLRIPAPKRKSD